MPAILAAVPLPSLYLDTSVIGGYFSTAVFIKSPYIIFCWSPGMSNRSTRTPSAENRLTVGLSDVELA